LGGSAGKIRKGRENGQQKTSNKNINVVRETLEVL